MTTPPGPGIGRRAPQARASMPPGYFVLWFLTLLSLSANAAFVFGLSQTDRIRDGVVTAARSVPLDPVPLNFTVEVNDDLPIQMDVPVKKTLMVPLDIVVPIDQVVTLDLEVMNRKVPVKLPIRAEVPVKSMLEVPVDEIVEVENTIPLDLSLPVEIQVDLNLFRDAILEAAEDL